MDKTNANNASGRPVQAEGQHNHASGAPLVSTRSNSPLTPYKHNNPNAKPVRAPGQSRANGVASTGTKHPARVIYKHNNPSKRAGNATSQTPFGA